MRSKKPVFAIIRPSNMLERGTRITPHNKKATLIWLEPESTKNAKKLIPKILKFLKKKIDWFAGPSGNPEFVSTHFKMKDPLTSNVFDSGVKIQQFKRT